MTPAGYNQNVHLVQTPDYIVLLNEMVHSSRVVPLDGRPHLPESMRQWMGGAVLTEGLFFGYPMRGLDCAAANRFVAEQLQSHPGCRGLMLIRPDDDPAEVEAELLESDDAHAIQGQPPVA